MSAAMDPQWLRAGPHDAWKQRVALAACGVASMAYLRGLQLRATAEDRGWHETHSREVGPAQLSLLLHPLVAGLGIAGSNQILDWRWNLRSLWRVPRPHLCGGRICPTGWGFGRQAWDLWPVVRDEVMPLVGARPLVIAGHSLGAAAGMQLDAALVELGRPPIAGYWFGSPRPGGERFAAYYRERVMAAHPRWSIVSGVAGWGTLEIVSRLPKSWAPMGWARSPFGFRHPEECDDAAIGCRRVILGEKGPVFGLTAWHAMRALDPVGWGRQFRILSRTRAAGRGHLLRHYRAQLER